MAAHEQLGGLAGLIGTWAGEGVGDYPTIEPFRYREEVVFAHAGKPFLTYRQRTNDAETGAPLHGETGYVRVVGDGRAEMVIAQPTGITEASAGTLLEGVLDVTDDDVGRTPSAKDVRRVRRRYALDGDLLTYDLWMAFADVPETQHLRARLHRQEMP